MGDGTLFRLHHPCLWFGSDVAPVYHKLLMRLYPCLDKGGKLKKLPLKLAIDHSYRCPAPQGDV